MRRRASRASPWISIASKMIASQREGTMQHLYFDPSRHSLDSELNELDELYDETLEKAVRG